MIPLSVPNFEGNEEKYVMDAVSQGWVSTGGAFITKMEQQIAEFIKVDNVAACQRFLITGTNTVPLVTNKKAFIYSGLVMNSLVANAVFILLTILIFRPYCF